MSADPIIMLVGHSEVEGELRFAEGVELSRVRTTLEAIAELESLRSGGAGRVLIVVTDRADPGATGADFREGVRTIDPAARVVRLCEGADRVQERGGHEATNGASGCDARVTRDGLAAEIERFVADSGVRAAPLEEPGEGVPARVEVSIRAGVLTPQEPAAEPAREDADPVAALLHGREVLKAALAQARARLGANVEFSAGEEGEGEPVRWHDRHFGWLRCDGADRAALRRECDALAGWLRLGEQQAELRRAALTDHLTGAWNRRYFDRFLPAAIERARLARGSLTLLVFDIDDFKRYNSEHGHGAGDEILIETVRLLRSVIRPTDRVCRIGGDEFCVIFHEPEGPRTPGSKPPENVYQISKRFQMQICKHEFPKLGSEAPGTLSISGGLATYPWDGRTAEELLRHADELALKSKRQGKNAITMGPGAARVCGMME